MAVNTDVSISIMSTSINKANHARRVLYLVLSRAFRNELSADSLGFIAALQPEVQSLSCIAGDEHFSLGGELLRQFTEGIPERGPEGEGLITDLRAEFVRLFLNTAVKPAYPCESVYRTVHGLVMQWPWEQVLEVYRSQSLVKSDGCPEPEDHISVELEFMAHLIESSGSGTAKQKAELLGLQKDFLDKHLLAWIPDFCQEVAEAAHSRFYAALAQLTHGYLNMENGLLDSLVSGNMSKALAKWDEALERTADSEAWNHFSGISSVLERKPGAGLVSGETRVVHSTCSQDCGGQCSLSYHLRNGRIAKVEPHDVGHPEYRPCARGLLVQYRVYAPDRLKFPLRRVGKRGEGKFIRISWDEALDEIKREIVRIRDSHGAGAILNLSHSGSTGRLHYASLSRRFLNLAGGQTRRWGGASNQGALFSNLATYGRLDTGHYRKDLLNSRLIILWGCDPARTIFGSETRYYLGQAKKRGVEIVVVDPRYTDSAVAFASKWIAIRPGTDAAMLVAMAYVIIERGLQDQEFLDRHTVGFDKFKAYVLGDEDGIARTPEWAEEITGVPAATITGLALEYVNRRPAALISGFAPGRSAAGEQFHRATSTLAIMSGNVGIPGGLPAGLDLGYQPAASLELAAKDYQALHTDVDEMSNPAEEGAPAHEYTVGGIRKHNAATVHASVAWDSVLRGKAGGYYNDIKMLYVTNGNCLNQYPDTNKGVRALNMMEFIVVHDMFMTPTAKYADIVLPVTTWCERNDIKVPWMFGHYLTYVNKAIEPMYQCKSDFQIFTELGERMGIEFSDKTEEEWLRGMATGKGVPDYDEFKATGFYQPEIPENYVAFEEQIRDPENNPFPTPSGKIEIFSQRIAGFNRPDVIPPIPKYVETWEGVADPRRKEYPLQLITAHPPNRVHSQLYNVPWLRDMEPHCVWINPADAGARGIRDKDEVLVFNDRGTIRIPARVTGRVMEGVVSIYEGAWYNPDPEGVDRGGCANVLTRGEHSPGGAFCSNTALVEIRKA